jgi:hypothetical protein
MLQGKVRLTLAAGTVAFRERMRAHAPAVS